MDDEERQQFKELLQIHRRRLHQLEAQAAKLGAYTPPHINIEIDDLRAEIAGIEASLGITSTHPAISIATRRDFYAHIALPPNYISRAELLAETCGALIADMQHTGSTR